MEKSKEKIAWIALLLITFLVPLMLYKGTHNYVLIKLSLTQVLVLLGLVLWIGGSLSSGKGLQLRRTPLDGPLVLFFFLALLSWFGSAYRWAGPPEIYRLITYLLLYGLTVNIIRQDGRRLTNLVSIWLLSTGLASLYGLYQYFGQGMLPPRSTFGNANFFAAYLVLVFPLTLIIFIHSIFSWGWRKNGGRIFSTAVLLVVMTLSLFLTSSRGAWIGLGIGLISLGWLACLRIGRRLLATRIIPAFLVLVIILTAFLIPHFLEKEFVREELERGTVGLRILIWEGTARMMAAHPFLGSGIGSFRVAYPSYRLPEYFRNPHAVCATDHAHNEFLQVAAEMGILGLGSFLGILIVFFIKGIELVRKEEDGSRRALLIGLISGVAGLLATNLFCVNLRFPSSAIFLWLAMGLVMSQSPPPLPSPLTLKGTSKGEGITTKLSLPLRRVIFGLALLLAVGAGWQVVAKPFLAERYFQRGVNYAQVRDWERTIYYYRKAMEIDPFFLEVHFRLGYAYASIGDVDRAIQTYEKILTMSPYFARTQANLGSLYLKKSDYEKALFYLKQAKELNPYDAIVLMQLAFIYSARGERER